MMDIQTLIVGVILLGAVGYASVVLARKARAFSPKAACQDDCGCSAKTKVSKAVH